MDAGSIASLASQMSNARLSQEIGIKTLKIAQDAQKDAGLALIAGVTPPPASANPPHLGNRVDTRA